MADVKLSNIANVTGTYDSIPTTLTSEAVITEMIAGLTILKTAVKQNWASGNLQYTITNGAQNAFETPTITDILDPTLIKLVADSVEVDGKKADYDYDEATGELKIVLDTIATETNSVITFQVQKV